MNKICSVVFFGYGGRNMGMGHIVRIETLARAFIKECKGVEVTVVIPSQEEGVEHIQKFLGNEVKIIPVDEEYSQSELIPDNFPQCDVAIFDCLNNPSIRLRAVRRKAGLVVTFDDSGEGVREADIAFNPLYVPLFSMEDSSVSVYAAPGYMPLRREFVACREKYKTKPDLSEKKRILILQGGVDGWNGITRIVRKLNEVRKDIIAVPVVGKAYAHYKDMKKTIEEVDIEVDLRQNVSNMPEIMIECAAAISGCGLSIFELLCMGVPSITLTDEEKELETAGRLAERFCVINLGRLSELKNESFSRALHKVLDDSRSRKKLSLCGMEEIDGNGAAKVVELIIQRYRKR